MEQPEAEALAHVAGQQTGLTARAEQTGDGAWQLVLADGGQTHTFPDAHSYRLWWDERTGGSSTNAKKASLWARWFARRSRGVTHDPDEPAPLSPAKLLPEARIQVSSRFGPMHGLADEEQLGNYVDSVVHPRHND